MSAMERQFQAELAASAHLMDGVFYHKIPDNPKGAGANYRFMAVKGYDCYLVVSGCHIAIECKMAHSLSIPFNALRNEQELALLDVLEAGAPAYVLVCFRVEVSKTRPAIIEAYAVPVRQWREQRMESERASLTYEWIAANGINVPRVSGGRWDLRPLIDRLFEKPPEVSPC